MDNVFSTIKDNINKSVKSTIEQVASEICENMKDKLRADGHAGSGALLDSIQYRVVSDDTGHFSVIIEMNDYGRFIDSGTGAAHGGNRQGSWRYKDRQGNWHTTDGMDADPFIEISVEKAIGGLSQDLSDRIRMSLKNRRGGGNS